MSRTFLGFGQVPYIGQPGAQAVKLGGIQTQVIPLLFQWLSYSASTSKPNINVLVDINAKACSPLDQIRSVYIDNLGSDNPVYVYFPDTNYTIVASPNSEGWYPAFTNSRQIWVIGEGFLTGDIPQSVILLSNVFIPPAVNVEINQSVDLWRASPIISRGNSIYNSAFGIPALGDQFFVSTNLNLQTPTVASLWNTPQPSGFLYITSILINSFNTQGGQATIALESLGVAGELFRFSLIGGAVAPNGSQNILSLVGMQLKLDATQAWRLRTVLPIAQGFITLFSSFTYQP